MARFGYPEKIAHPAHAGEWAIHWVDTEHPVFGNRYDLSRYPEEGRFELPEGEWERRLLYAWNPEKGAAEIPAPQPPSRAHLARMHAAAGLRVTSASEPGVGGTYAATPAALQDMHGAVVFAATSGRLPGSSGFYAVRDAAGGTHAVSSPAVLEALYAALHDFAADCAAYEHAGGELPAAEASIA